MYTIRFFTLLIALFPVSLHAQTALADSLTVLKNMVQDVRVGKDDYKQILTYDAEAPYRVSIAITEIDRKGREEELRLELNLALMNARRVRYEDGKDQIKVTLEANNDAAVKEYEDGEFEGYEDEAYLLALNVDNARAMERVLEAVIPMAKEQWEKDNQLPEDFTGLQQWIKSMIKDISVDDDRWEQSWSHSTDQPTRVSLMVTEEGKDDHRYDWNLADVNPSSIEVQVKGKVAKVEMDVRDRKDYIRVEEQGVLDGYDDSVELLFEEVDDAQLAAAALRQLAKQAAEIEEKNEVSYETATSARAALNQTLTNFKREETAIEQRLSGDCQATYEYTEDEEGDTEANKYIFDFADLNPGSIDIEIKGTALTVVAEVRGGEDYVYVEENGEQENYDDEVSFPVEDLPKAKLVVLQLKKIIEACPNEVTTKDFAWMKSELESVEAEQAGLTQTLELLEGDDCKWVFTQAEEKRDEIEEERYEFNLYDLNPRKVKMDISGKSVIVEVETNGGEDIIKTFSEDEEEGYEDELEFVLKNVAAGKAFAASLKAVIEGCEE
jgi:hypothetical protein